MELRMRNAKRLVLNLAIAGVIASASGCGDEPVDTGVSSGAIQGGSNDTTHTFAVGIVGQVSRGTFLCSGALLAPNLVATARHCVASIPSNGVVACPSTQFGSVYSASSLVVVTDAKIGSSSPQYAVSQIVVPSGTNQAAICGHDIALLVLAKNIDLPSYVTPVLKPDMTDHTVYSTNVTAIGYGLTSANDPSGASAGTRRIRQQIALTCIPNDKTFPNCLSQLSSEMTSAEFMSGNGTCDGDSGSSAYEQTNFDAGKWVSFGVLSRGGQMGSTCEGGVYSRFDAWSSLIISTAQQAAAAGGYAVPSWATDQDGGSGDQLDAGSGGKPAGGAGASGHAGGAGGASSGGHGGAVATGGGAGHGSGGASGGTGGHAGATTMGAGAVGGTVGGLGTGGSQATGGTGGLGSGGRGAAGNPAGAISGSSGGLSGQNAASSPGQVTGGCACDLGDAPGGQWPLSVLGALGALVARGSGRRRRC
jgi:hypothetical protein